jgi:hypothetical protein
MKTFLRRTIIVGGVGLAGVFAFRALQAGRRRLKRALARAEGVASQTQETLEQTQALLHEVRTAI